MNLESLIKRAAEDMAGSKYAIVLTGAGMSTESEIPDFRGPKGIWTTNKEAEAKAYQRYELFLSDPKAYWEEILGLQGTYGTFHEQIRQAQPNPGHYALAELEALGILRCIITQNIDGLHKKAGSKRVLEYHGSVNAVRCLSCGSRFSREEISLNELPPHCKCGAVLKDDVVHFKEPIPLDVMTESENEALQCDLMLICGTSAVVYPFANLPRMARYRARRLAAGFDLVGHKTNVKIIEVNADPTPLTHEGVSDYLVQGKTGEILPRIVEELKEARFHNEH
ncbi:MAG: NAD-dependent deacylase [Dehalococcoidia bacterium]|nr:NAD-dependent deacylase [Dehalococcoidia bacterium]